MTGPADSPSSPDHDGSTNPDDVGDVDGDIDQGDVRERRRTPRRRRRGRTNDVITVISWRDIPAQLAANGADEQHKLLLHARFQHAIDRAAGVAGLTSTDDYVREWRTTTRPLVGDPAGALDRLGRELDDAYPRERLEAIVAAGGLDPGASDELDRSGAGNDPGGTT